MVSVETDEDWVGKQPWGGQKLGAYLVAFALIGWMIAMPTIELFQAHHHGYGSGIGDGGRIPPAVVQMYGNVDRDTLVQITMAKPTWERHNPFEGGWTR